MNENKPPNPLNEEKFAKLVHRTLDHWHVPGIAIAVVDGDQTWAEGYGIATFPSTPVTSSTLFYAGSTTKSFTAAMMAKLVENADYPHVQWDTPISQLIPGDFALHDEYATQHITIEDALSHRTGLPRHDQALSISTVRNNVRRLRHLPMTAEPRTTYQYCNFMYIVASHVIETLTGEWLGDCLARDNGTYHEVEWMQLEEISGAGAVITNVLDYAKWTRAFLNQNTSLHRQIFSSPNTVSYLWQPRTLMPSEEPFTGPRAYTLGWRTGVYQGVQIYEHTGGMNAFGAQLILIPQLQYGVVLLANTAGTSNFTAQTLAFHLIDEKLGIPEEKRFDFNKRNWSSVNEDKRKTIDRINHVPCTVLPPALPLIEYTGKYSHPGYKAITVYLAKDGMLHADRVDMTFPEFITFKHLSGEHFLVISEHHGDLGAFFPEVYAAEFRLDVEGKPSTLGVAWEKTMGDSKIWFTRV